MRVFYSLNSNLSQISLSDALKWVFPITSASVLPSVKEVKMQCRRFSATELRWAIQLIQDEYNYVELGFNTGNHKIQIYTYINGVGTIYDVTN